MNWNDTLKERATIEHCRGLHYDREVEDITEENEMDEDDLHDGDDWEYWTNRMKEDLEKRGGAK